MKNISDLIKNREIADLPVVEFEFQYLALQMIQEFKPHYPSVIWSLFHKPEYTLDMIRETWFVYQKQPIKELNYFIGILRNKAKIKKS